MDGVDVSRHRGEFGLELLLNLHRSTWLHPKQEGPLDAGASERNVGARQRRDGNCVDDLYAVDAGLRERRGFDVPRRVPPVETTAEVAARGPGQPVNDGRLVKPQLNNPASHGDEHTVR
jgi:hypothetical protein